LRYLARHPLLALLNIASVGLGVAVYFAIQIANQSANGSFAATVDLVAGRSHLQVTAPGANLRDDLLPLVSRQTGLAAATPLVRGLLTLPDFPGEYLDLLGIDVFTNEPFRTFELSGFGNDNLDIHQWFGAPGGLAISDEFAELHNTRAGDSLRVQVNGATRVVPVVAVLRTSDRASNVDPRFAAMDIGWAQELLGRRGFLSTIELRLKDVGQREKVSAELRKILPPDATIAAPARRSEQVEKMLSGFELNLTAMSLVSLLVGMFLIYNTVSASVLRRQHELGILRSLGVTRNEVRALFLGEALVLGAIGIAVGLGCGLLLARGLVGAVSSTISSLYVLLSVREIVVAPWMIVAAVVLGVGSVVSAAWLPANAAATMDPVRALSPGAFVEQSLRPSRWWILAGGASLVAAAVLSWSALASGPPWLGFGAAFFVLAGFSALVPGLTFGFGRGAFTVFSAMRRHVSRPFVEQTLAATNIGRSLHRNAVTIAALAAAVAMTVAVGVMVFSFRQTVGAWVDQTLVADLFIAPAANEIVGPSSFIPPAAVDLLRSNSNVAAVDTVREIDIPFRNNTVALGVISGTDRRNLRFLHGRRSEIMRNFYSGESLLVSESFSRRFRVREGDLLELPSPAGIRTFAIGGIFFDYTRDQGLIFISRSAFVPLWNDDRINSIAVYLDDGRSASAVTEAFRERFSRDGEFAIYSNRVLRTRIFEVFDQTFAVTYVLRTIAVLVAVVGIFLALTTLVTERNRELGVLRAIGASAAQLRRILLWESAMIGLLASVIGVVSGLCLSLVLTGVINRAFFGWTIELAIPWRSLGATPLWIIAASLVASWIPAQRAGRLVIADAVRAE
jgi:putative ABC transport system permease protein